MVEAFEIRAQPLKILFSRIPETKTNQIKVSVTTELPLDLSKSAKSAPSSPKKTVQPEWFFNDKSSSIIYPSEFTSKSFWTWKCDKDTISAKNLILLMWGIKHVWKILFPQMISSYFKGYFWRLFEYFFYIYNGTKV